jgi:hypothetical protein
MRCATCRGAACSRRSAPPVLRPLRARRSPQVRLARRCRWHRQTRSRRRSSRPGHPHCSRGRTLEACRQIPSDANSRRRRSPRGTMHRSRSPDRCVLARRLCGRSRHRRLRFNPRRVPTSPGWRPGSGRRPPTWEKRRHRLQVRTPRFNLVRAHTIRARSAIPITAAREFLVGWDLIGPGPHGGRRGRSALSAETRPQVGL